MSGFASCGSLEQPRPNSINSLKGLTIQFPNCQKENGAGDEIRTHDIHLGKVTLYP